MFASKERGSSRLFKALLSMKHQFNPFWVEFQPPVVYPGVHLLCSHYEQSWLGFFSQQSIFSPNVDLLKPKLVTGRRIPFLGMVWQIQDGISGQNFRGDREGERGRVPLTQRAHSFEMLGNPSSGVFFPSIYHVQVSVPREPVFSLPNSPLLSNK